MTSGEGTSESFITMDNTVMHATEHYSASSTAMTLPTDPSSQDYECCECFVTFEEDVMLGNDRG